MVQNMGLDFKDNEPLTQLQFFRSSLGYCARGALGTCLSTHTKQFACPLSNSVG